MELKFFKFYFRQLLVIVNTYFAENDRIKKKKNANFISSRSSWILLYGSALHWKKNFLANVRDKILDFSFTSFNLSSCEMPLAH